MFDTVMQSLIFKKYYRKSRGFNVNALNIKLLTTSDLYTSTVEENYSN